MSRRRGCPGCCDQGPCFTLLDLFTRADVGPTWSIKSGTWSIIANELNESGTSGAVLLMEPAPTPHPTHHSVGVVVDEPALSVGAKPRIIVNSNAAGTSYHYVEWEKTGSTTGTLRLGSTGGGILLEKTGLVMGDFNTLSACFKDGLFAGSVANDPGPSSGWWIYLCAATATEDYVGLGNGAASSVTFDEFFIRELFPYNPLCTVCLCSCDGVCLPHTLTVTLTLTYPSGDCASIHGKEFSIVLPQGGVLWTISPTVLTICGHSVGFDFGCMDLMLAEHLPAPPGSGDFILAPLLSDPFLCEGLTHNHYEAYYTCNPVEIVFGPYGINHLPGVGCDCCVQEGSSNEVWFTITIP